MAEQATALLYNLEQTPKGNQVKFLLIRMGIHIKNIRPEQYLVPLKILSGADSSPDTCKAYTGEGFPEEMLVMKNFSGAQLDEFLLRMRKAKIPRIDLKAILTPSNQEWDSITLYKELKREHAAMQHTAMQQAPPDEI